MSVSCSSDSTGTHSSVRCMVRLRSPNSATGQWSLMKRASDVPPVVLRVGVPARHGGDGLGDDRAEPTRRGHEGLARDLDRQVVGLAGRIEARADGAFEARASVAVVEADVEAHHRRAGNDVRGLVADVDRSKFQPARLKMVGPLVQRQSEQRIQQRNETGQRVVRQRRIGDVPLPASRPGACR